MSAPGNGPPDWEPTEIWNALAERPRPSAVVELPVKSYRGESIPRVRIQVLRRDEDFTARIKALSRTVERMRAEFRDFTDKDVPGNPVAEELLQNYSACETLARALVSVDGVTKSEHRPEDGRDATIFKRLFRNSDDIARMVGDDELAVLWAQYRCVQRERGPLKDTMTEAEVHEWVNKLAKAADALPLYQLTSPALVKLTLSLALLVAKLSGLSPDSSPSEGSQNGPGSTVERSQIGTSYFGPPLDRPGLPSSSQDDTVIGSDPEDAALIVHALSDTDTE